jgi:hypothetical protein
MYYNQISSNFLTQHPIFYSKLRLTTQNFLTQHDNIINQNFLTQYDNTIRRIESIYYLYLFNQSKKQIKISQINIFQKPKT